MHLYIPMITIPYNSTIPCWSSSMLTSSPNLQTNSERQHARPDFDNKSSHYFYPGNTAENMMWTYLSKDRNKQTATFINTRNAILKMWRVTWRDSMIRSSEDPNSRTVDDNWNRFKTSQKTGHIQTPNVSATGRSELGMLANTTTMFSYA